MKKLINSALLTGTMLITACSSSPIKGTWQYEGGVYSGRPQNASSDFKMQREYTDKTYDANMIEGETKEKYASGRYEIKADTLYLTGEFSSQPSQLVGKTIAYTYTIANGKLTIKGTLPNGMQVEEYWKKVD